MLAADHLYDSHWIVNSPWDEIQDILGEDEHWLSRSISTAGNLFKVKMWNYALKI